MSPESVSTKNSGFEESVGIKRESNEDYNLKKTNQSKSSAEKSKSNPDGTGSKKSIVKKEFLSQLEHVSKAQNDSTYFSASKKKSKTNKASARNN